MVLLSSARAGPAASARAATAVRRAIANRGSLETVIPAVPEEACGILCGDAAECRTDRCMQGVDRARTDLAQLGLELGPGGLDRAQIRAVGRQVAIGEPRTLEHGLHLGRL